VPGASNPLLVAGFRGMLPPDRRKNSPRKDNLGLLSGFQ